MPATELLAEVAAVVSFLGCEINGALVGVMGIQPVRNVRLIRHAYVLPPFQGLGVGRLLLTRLRRHADRPTLVGTWAAAGWAIGFYRRHGFEPVPRSVEAELLRTYWTVSSRQIETSLVLAAPALTEPQARALMQAAGS